MYTLMIERKGKTAKIVSRDAYAIGAKIAWGSGARWTVVECR